MRLILPGRTKETAVTLPVQQAEWLDDLLREASPHANRTTPYPLLREAKAMFPGSHRDFESLLNSPAWKKVRAAGLLLV
jgi:hypothetical protein